MPNNGQNIQNTVKKDRQKAVFFVRFEVGMVIFTKTMPGLQPGELPQVL